MSGTEIIRLDCGEICVVRAGLPDLLICMHCCQARKVVERL